MDIKEGAPLCLEAGMTDVRKSACGRAWEGFAGPYVQQADNITHPQRSIDLLLGHAGAGKMHACLDANEFLTCLDELQGEV